MTLQLILRRRPERNGVLFQIVLAAYLLFRIWLTSSNPRSIPFLG